MGHGACVFWELCGAQQAHVFDALDGFGGCCGSWVVFECFSSQVLAELLVAENRQAFFERELEPVAASDAVARPVVEVFMADHALDVGVVHVGGSGRVGQHKLGVEDVEALVFHRAHVEVAGGDDHEALEVEAQVKALLVPLDAGHERVHGMFGFVQIARAHKHLQQMFFARWRFDALLAAHKLACDQSKQVARLFVRVDPLGKVAAFLQVAFFHQVAVAQQNWECFFVGTQRDAVVGHHIRAVQEVSDAAKALGLTLREERVVAHIQAHELGVLRRVAGGEDFQVESIMALGQVLQHQLAAVHLE